MEVINFIQVFKLFKSKTLPKISIGDKIVLNKSYRNSPTKNKKAASWSG